MKTVIPVLLKDMRISPLLQCVRLCFYLSGVYGQTCDRVIYTDRSICASKGSSVDISCTYSSYQTIRSKFWFSPDRSHQWQSPSQPEDLSEDSQFAGRVQVLESERGRSTLRITDLTESDSAQYHFKFTTGNFEWRSSLPGTTLTVTELKCHSSCSPAGRLSYVWFKNGQKVTGVETSSFKGRVYPGDIISCALKGHENYGSPPVSEFDPLYQEKDMQTHWLLKVVDSAELYVTG
uniref:Ig-like domain-containing protein n=1 Tax=Sparus aurata TaxID=8175 RepID=A0A671TD07_SPAAU